MDYKHPQLEYFVMNEWRNERKKGAIERTNERIEQIVN